MTGVGFIVLLVAAFAIFAVGSWMSRGGGTDVDPATRAKADRVFEEELADIEKDRGDA